MKELIRELSEQEVSNVSGGGLIGNLVNTVLGNSTVTDNVLGPTKDDVKTILGSVGIELNESRLDDVLNSVI